MAKSFALLLVAIVLLWRRAEALEALRPPAATPSDFFFEFGCAMASSNSQLAVFALSTPFSDGLEAWRIFSFTQKSGTGNWTTGPTFSPSSASEGAPNPGTAPCFIDMNSGNLVIGEPWAQQGSGRVLWAKQLADGFSSPVVVDQGKINNDGFGKDVAVFNEWMIASAPKAESPYVRIYRYGPTSQFDFHSELTLQDVVDPSVAKVRSGDLFGAWIDVRNNWMAIGTPSDSGAGKVYMFKYAISENKWALFQTIEPNQDEQGTDRTTFGTIVALRGNKLFVSAPGSSTSSGSVFAYRFGLHDEWEVSKIIKSPHPEKADDFGRAISVTETTLAVSQASTPTDTSSAIHVYRQCGEYPLALHEVITPDETERLVHGWGRRVAWNLDALTIASPGLVNIWNLPGAGHCNTQVGVFPTPACCDKSINVVVDPSGTVLVRGADSSVVSFTEAPVIIAGNLNIDSSSVVALRKGIYVAIEGNVAFAGKLKYELPRPTEDGSHSLPVDHLIRYSTRRGSFSEIEVTFEAGETKCDRIQVQPVYGASSLSLIVSVQVNSNCKTSSNPLIPVYVTLVLLAFVVLTVIFVLWKFPQLRDMISRPARPESNYRHTRIINEDDDERALTDFRRYPSQDDLDDDRHSLGAETASEDENDEDFI